jgi:hypothetical protein
MSKEEEKLDLVWGAKGIAKEINRTATQTHYLLSSGAIQCARQVGKQWVCDRRDLRREFCRPADKLTPTGHGGAE